MAARGLVRGVAVATFARAHRANADRAAGVQTRRSKLSDAMPEFDRRASVTDALRIHGAALRRYVRARVDPADVDDILQVAALRAIEKAHTLRDPERIFPWLCRVHGNVIVDAARDQARERRLIEAASREAEPLAGETEPASICGCSVTQARKLSETYASILDLVDLGGVSLGVAARQLDISVNNATVRLHRARAALKKRLMDHCGVTSFRACADCRNSYEGCCDPRSPTT